MIVLSLFDGMSCGQIALHELGITPDVYYASEIDKHAIAQTQLNFPNTIQLGSVVNVNVSDLQPIDLLIGGSPCQSFSFAGKRKGMSTKCNEEIYTLDRYLKLKAEGFEFEGQSYLFWEYMRILIDIRKYNPNVLFLLENVEMGNKWERVLSEAIGIFGVHINSALVSAQNRKRIYWTNIRTRQEGLFGELHSDIPQPDDRGILLRDILEREVDEKYYLSEKMIDWFGKHGDKRGTEMKVLDGSTKAACITATANVKQNLSTDYVCVSMVGRKLDENGVRKDNNPNIKAIQRLEPNIDGKTNCLTSVQKDNLILQRGRGFNKGGVHEGKTPVLTSNSWEQNNFVLTENYLQLKSNGYDSDNRFFFEDGKHGSVLTKGEVKTGVVTETRIRRLTPIECARLQTIPEWYKWACSDTQQYRMLGNGWTVKVIMHIFSFMKVDTITNNQNIAV